MKTKNSFSDGRSGMTLVVVMVMTMLCSAAVSSVLWSVGVKMNRGHKQVDMEKAFYIAEAGMEVAAAWVATGGEDHVPFTGNIGGGSYVTTIAVDNVSAFQIGVRIVSTGTINGTSRTVTVNGLERISWARYALWYDREQMELSIAVGDKFYGRFYSKPQMRFGADVGGENAEFFDRVWTVPATIKDANGEAHPTFHQGIVYNAEVQEISSVSFDILKQAAQDSPEKLVLLGNTDIVLNGTTMKVTNAEKGWNKKPMPIPDQGIVYVDAKTHTKETQVWVNNWWGGGKWVTQTVTVTEGDLSVAAPNGFTGQLTLVAEDNINIVDHVKYNDDPRDNPDSQDKLGLIAQNNAWIKSSAPPNVEVFAHIFCRDGGFGVENYDTRKKCGTMIIYGGIANLIRNAVGTGNGGTGYKKNYFFDKRFSRNPPPYYPRLTDVLAWDGWEG